VPYNLDGLTKGQAAKVLEQAAIDIVNTLTNAILARADKEGAAAFKVKPAYTSVMGKFKYMAQRGIPIHIAAALVIARRGMGFREKVPPVLSAALPEKIKHRHHWAHWAYLQKQVKRIKTHLLYRLGKELEAGVPFREALERLKFLPRAG
jgi:hypothetical protein